MCLFVSWEGCTDVSILPPANKPNLTDVRWCKCPFFPKTDIVDVLFSFLCVRKAKCCKDWNSLCLTEGLGGSRLYSPLSAKMQKHTDRDGKRGQKALSGMLNNSVSWTSRTAKQQRTCVWLQKKHGDIQPQTLTDYISYKQSCDWQKDSMVPPSVPPLVNVMKCSKRSWYVMMFSSHSKLVHDLKGADSHGRPTMIWILILMQPFFFLIM